MSETPTNVPITCLDCKHPRIQHTGGRGACNQLPRSKYSQVCRCTRFKRKQAGEAEVHVPPSLPRQTPSSPVVPAAGLSPALLAAVADGSEFASAWTPGPWSVNGSAIEADLPDGTECVAHVYDGIEAPPSGSAEANARLIAAAPDLLMACQNASDDCGVIRFVDKLGESQAYYTLPYSCMNAIRAALAKVEGK